MNGQSGITIENPRCLYGPCDRASGQQYQQFTAEVPIGNMPDGEHTISAIAHDAAGNASQLSQVALRFDSTPPQAPTGLTIVKDPSTGDAYVDWESSPDVLSGISSWKVRIRPPGGTWSAWTTQVTDQIEIPGAVEGTVWEVEVVNIDAVRNESASAYASLTVPAPTLPGTSYPGDEPEALGVILTEEQLPEGVSAAELGIPTKSDLERTGSLPLESEGSLKANISVGEADVASLARLDDWPTRPCGVWQQRNGAVGSMSTVRAPERPGDTLSVRWAFFLTLQKRIEISNISPLFPIEWSGFREVNGNRQTHSKHYGAAYHYHGQFYVQPGAQVWLNAELYGQMARGRIVYTVTGHFRYRCTANGPANDQ